MRNTLALIMGAAGMRNTRSASVNAGGRVPGAGRRSATHALPRRATRLRRHSQSRVSRTARVPRDGRCGLATTATECADGGHRMLRFSNGRVQAAGGLRRARLGVPTVMGGADVRAAFRRLLMHSSEGVAR